MGVPRSAAGVRGQRAFARRHVSALMNRSRRDKGLLEQPGNRKVLFDLVARPYTLAGKERE